jgi:hypothetical protein
MSDIALFVEFSWQKGVPIDYLNAACQGMKDVVYATRLQNKLHPGSFHGNDESRWNLAPIAVVSQMVDRATESAFRKKLRPGQLDIDSMLHDLSREWQASREQNVMPFVVVRQDYASVHNGHREPFVMSGNRPPAAATISTFRFEESGLKNRIHLFRLMAAREFAHFMGAPHEDRGNALANVDGTHHMHCSVPQCIMQHRPDLEAYAQDILPLYADTLLCKRCRADICDTVDELIHF